jgi:transposase-like protein
MRKRYTAEQRERLVAEVRSTGEKVPVVAARMGVQASTAYLWIKQAGVPASKPTFARVMRTQVVSPSSVVLEVARVRVVVEAGFDAGLLREVVAALSNKP